MSRHLILFAALAVSLTGIQNAQSAPAKQALSGKVKAIDGTSVDLKTYAGKVVLVVNVASRCGFTSQYKQLQALHTKYAERGLVVLGFPCNQFGKQESGSNKKIQRFCKATFGVSFPMFSKIKVNGRTAPDLYTYLTSDKIGVADKGPVKWNFEKFLIDRTGKVIGRYRSPVKPDDKLVIKTIERALTEEALKGRSK